MNDQAPAWNIDTSSPLAAARSYTLAGCVVVPVPHRSKRPRLPEWQRLRLGLDDLRSHFNGAPMNIGVLLGASSGGLVDVDLDCPQARQVAALLLPPTSTFGRASAPASHWLYYTSSSIPRIQTWKDVTGGMIIEIRGTGHQTVFPGSTHESGEAIAFCGSGAPMQIDAAGLKTAAARVAAASLLARHWPGEGGRHEAALELAGALLRSGWPDDDARTFIEAVARAAGDPEIADRVRTVESTRGRLESGQTVRGVPALAHLVGEDVCGLMAKWLELRAARRHAYLPEGSAPYYVNETGTWWNKPTNSGPVPVQLANFCAVIKADIREDDGAEVVRKFEIEATGPGLPSTQFVLAADDFAAMQWPLPTLGAQAIVMPGPSIQGHLRVAIQTLSKSVAARTVFTHTGWTMWGGRPVYLHSGGGIGEDGMVPGLETRLDGGLDRFRLPQPPRGEDLDLAAAAVLGLLKLGPPALVCALLSSVVRAILGGSDFSVFLVGETGTFKSETAALFQRFFGAGFDARHLPGSWTSTVNALEDTAFRVKDAIFVVDDFKPAGDHGDARLQAQADRLLRAQGNGAARQRMRSDLTLRPTRPPRGLMLCTGEELPAGESLRARLMHVAVAGGDVDVARLTMCQADAGAGKYAAFTAAFVRWCAGRLEELRGQLRARVADVRGRYRSAHARISSAIAELDMSFEILLRFIIEETNERVLTRAEGEAELAEFRRAFQELVESQQAEVASANPVRRFQELLPSVLATGVAHVVDRDGGAPPGPDVWGWRRSAGQDLGWLPQGARIGVVDGAELYLDAPAAYRAVKAAAAAPDGISVSAGTLWKRLYH